MRSLTLRRAAVTVAFPLALTSLAACGSNDGSTTATDGTGDASNAALSTTAKPVDKAQFIDQLKAAGEKITTVDVAMDMDMSGQTIPVKATLDMTGDTPAAAMTMTLPGLGSAMDMRLVDKTMYIQMPGGNGKYVKVPLDDPHSPFGQLGGTVDNLNPDSLASGLSPSMLQKVTDHGVSTVDGQQLHHYTAVMSLGDLAKKLPNMPDLPSTASLPKRASYDVWLDSEGRFAKFALLMKNSMRMTMRYSGYGTAAHVTAPPASQITSMSSLSGLTGGLSS